MSVESTAFSSLLAENRSVVKKGWDFRNYSVDVDIDQIQRRYRVGRREPRYQLQAMALRAVPSAWNPRRLQDSGEKRWWGTQGSSLWEGEASYWTQEGSLAVRSVSQIYRDETTQCLSNLTIHSNYLRTC